MTCSGREWSNAYDACLLSSCLGEVYMLDTRLLDDTMEITLHKVAVQIRIMHLPYRIFVIYIVYKHYWIYSSFIVMEKGNVANS